jgi:hypothetical protein
MLTPGSGWIEATAQPAAIGSSSQAGYDDQAIARWDVVPFQTFDGDLAVGVPAFHMNGIDRVTFSVDNGPWVEVKAMTLNPQSSVVEYWVVLRASSFASDKAVEVRAVAYPPVGVPRVLDSLQLFANAGHTLASPTFHVKPSTGSDSNAGTAESPWASLKYALGRATDGAVVILDEAGEYDIDRTGLSGVGNNRWITVQPAAGLSQSSVILMTAGGITTQCRPNITRLCLRNLTIDWSKVGVYSPVGGTYTWWDSVRWYSSSGRTAMDDGHPHPSNLGYVTGGVCEDRFCGYNGLLFVRGATVQRVGGDVFACAQCVLHCTIDDFKNEVGWDKWHSDIFQYYQDQSNVLVYDVKTTHVQTVQNIFVNQPMTSGNSMRNCAFVDLDLDYQTPTDGGLSQWQGPMKHVLFKNVRNEQPMSFRTDMTDLNHFAGTDIVFESCALPPANYDAYVVRGLVPPGVTFKGCTSQ